MSRVSPIQTNFNGGELSPYMLGRIDHDVYGISTAAMVGWIPRPQGGVEACPGFEFVAKARGPCRLIPVEPYTTQGYVIEASDHCFRFYTNDVRLEDGGEPIELVTPWSLDLMREMKIVPSNDVIYLFHRTIGPQLLVRTGASSFELELMPMYEGPFDDRNGIKEKTVAASGVTGSVTVTASSAMFEAGDVGGLFEMEAGDLNSVRSWEPGITVTIGQKLQWNGRVYQVAAGSTSPLRTGTVQPAHHDGSEWDGIGIGKDLNDKDAGGVLLTYVHDMFGRMLITGYTSPTQVQAQVTRRLPETVMAGTWRWSFGAFSNRRGWPSGGAIHGQRLWLFRDDRVYASEAGNLSGFDRYDENGDVSDDCAFVGTVDNPNPIRWMMSGQELFLGTAVAEHAIRQASQARGIAPGNIKLAGLTNAGSAERVQPIQKDGVPIFLQRNGRKLLMLSEQRIEAYAPDDLTRYADHIGNSPFVEFCWQREPLQLIWGVREDGVLVCADTMPSEQVLGWCRRELAPGMAARSICSITSPDGRRDQLWCAAELDGEWFVMLLSSFRQAGEADATAIMADAALRYTGAPVSQVRAPHLAGRTLTVVADGAWLGEFTPDADGWISLGREASDVMAGLAFPAYIDLLPIEAGGDSGPAQGKMKRNGRILVRVLQSLGLRLTVQGTAQRALENQMGNSPMDTALPLVTADIINDMVGTWDRAGQVRIERTAPKQCTVLAIGITSEVAGR